MNLQDSLLLNVQFFATEMGGADLRRAELYHAVFDGAKLDGANLTAAALSNTFFHAVDLGNVIGLEHVRHDGPSNLSFETLMLSAGKLPLVFLRGVGFPEKLIEYLPSLCCDDAIQFYTCFVSYSGVDQPFADRLYSDLQDRGVRCWFAPHDIHGGRKIHEQIDEAIRVYDKLLLILSEASMNSNWVKTEIANARAREKTQKRQMLFPITIVPFDRIKEWRLFDADRGVDSAREIREYFIPDFSNWKDLDAYENALARLLRDLKTDVRTSQ